MSSGGHTDRSVPLTEALATSRANKVGRMVGRAGDNRIEPECWPVVKPGFQFSKDHKFFTIGSCFAGNIGRRLKVDGYKVHGSEAMPGEQRNRYTPASIFQEIEWAGRIFHRDGIVTEQDVEALLIETSPGRFSDLWSRPGQGAPVDTAGAIERRQSLYNYFSGAFQADIIVVTLGLIEGWWDEVSKTYVEFDTPWARRRDRERFRFEALGFDKCKDFVRRTLELLLDGKRRVLITTSPVVLSRTFTDKDIIVANTHSKSVLRAVAGELSDEIDGVDYFPSYEIATISSREQVWEDDLVHIKPNFVGRIMQHVTNAYVPGSVADETRELMHMANLVDVGNFAAAGEAYDRVTEAANQSQDLAVHAAAIRLALHRGDSEAAARHALRFDSNSDALYLSHPDWMLLASRAFAASPEHRELGERMATRLADLCAATPHVLLHFYVNRERARDEDGLKFVIAIAEQANAGDPMLAHRACVKLHALGETSRAIALAERQLQVTPDNGMMLGRYARLLLADGRIAEAIAPLRRLVELEPDSDWAWLALARTLFKDGKLDEAFAAVERLLEGSPRNPEALAFKARVLARLGRKAEAAECARATADACNGDPRILRSIQTLLPA